MGSIGELKTHRQPGVFEAERGAFVEISRRLKLFFAKVQVDKATGCWKWTGAVRRWSREPWDGGYGAFWDGDRVVRAHVWLYRVYFGDLDAGQVLLHQCDERRCVNVFQHIRPGSQAENIVDMVMKGRAKFFKKGN